MKPGLKLNQYLMLLLFCLLCLATGGIGGFVTSGSVETWYPTLTKPWFNPPAAVFAPVWTVLYLMMAVAAWRVWIHGEPAEKSRALLLFWFQLGLNLLWSIMFFGLQQLGVAVAEIVLLLLAIVITTLLFWRIDRLAGMLMLPYIAWVSFATVLNISLWLLNAF